jgi:cytochrome c2
MKNTFLIFFAAVLFTACGQSRTSSTANNTGGQIISNTTTPGRQLFINNCVQCHAFKQDKMGPMLDGVFTRWSDSLTLAAFVKNSGQVIKGGQNAYATALYHKWSDAIMPSFTNLSDEELKEILAYVHAGVE